MPSPDGRPVFIPHVPWHTAREHPDLPETLAAHDEKADEARRAGKRAVRKYPKALRRLGES